MVATSAAAVGGNRELRGSSPWSGQLDLRSGALWPASYVVTCHLSNMPGRYHDKNAEADLLASDPLIYRADEIEVPEVEGHLRTSVTVLYPGKVGDEYFMSKGHFNAREQCVKVYLALRGHGYLLMQTADGRTREVLMAPGTIAYCAPGWAQRTVNIGQEPFVYFKSWPAHAGEDYDSILHQGGFRIRIVERDGVPILVDSGAVGAQIRNEGKD